MHPWPEPLRCSCCSARLLPQWWPGSLRDRKRSWMDAAKLCGRPVPEAWAAYESARAVSALCKLRFRFPAAIRGFGLQTIHPGQWARLSAEVSRGLACFRDFLTAATTVRARVVFACSALSSIPTHQLSTNLEYGGSLFFKAGLVGLVETRSLFSPPNLFFVFCLHRKVPTDRLKSIEGFLLTCQFSLCSLLPRTKYIIRSLTAR